MGLAGMMGSLNFIQTLCQPTHGRTRLRQFHWCYLSRKPAGAAQQTATGTRRSALAALGV